MRLYSSMYIGKWINNYIVHAIFMSQMGIKDMQWFMRKRYLKKLDYEPLTGPLVIDGCGIMYNLYRECHIDWRVGGRYSIFKTKVAVFFKTLAVSCISPVVVIDGLGNTLCKRKREAIKAIKGSIKARRRYIKKPVTPPFMQDVFLEALRETGCELVFADGEANPVIVQTANKLKCPVLANNSDFFTFPLTNGFILYNKEILQYKTASKKYEAKVFRQDDFVRKWLVCGTAGEIPPNNDLCLLIPALMGNNILQPTHGIINKYGKPSILDAVKYIANQKVRSLDHFQSMCSNEKLNQNISRCIQIYSSERQSLDAGILTVTKLPKSILELHRRGCLPGYITQALVSSKAIIKVPADSPYELNSSVLASREIRRGIYALVGLPEVTEYFARHGNLVQEVVRAKHLSSQGMENMNDFLSEVLMLDIASSPPFQESFFKRWHLVAISLIYWSKIKHRRKTHVKALILVMAEYFHSTSTQKNKYLPPFSNEWVYTLHVFSEWQFIYHDLCVANTLLGSPLEVVSPCSLYDGHKAILYSLNSQLASTAWSKLQSTTWHDTLLRYLSIVSDLDHARVPVTVPAIMRRYKKNCRRSMSLAKLVKIKVRQQKQFRSKWALKPKWSMH